MNSTINQIILGQVAREREDKKILAPPKSRNSARIPSTPFAGLATRLRIHPAVRRSRIGAHVPGAGQVVLVRIRPALVGVDHGIFDIRTEALAASLPPGAAHVQGANDRQLPRQPESEARPQRRVGAFGEAVKTEHLVQAAERAAPHRPGEIVHHRIAGMDDDPV